MIIEVCCVLLVFRLCAKAAEYAIMRMYGHITKMVFCRFVWLHISYQPFIGYFQ